VGHRVERRKLPSDDALWMRRDTNYAVIAQDYGVDVNWLSLAASRVGFSRDRHGKLTHAPCRLCGERHTRRALEPARICPDCRAGHYMDEPWYADYQAARQAYLARMAKIGIHSGDLVTTCAK
jgi:hypothetical protein